MKQPTHGGRRQNAGRKSGPQGPRVKTAITMRPDLYEATKAARSGMIEAALDQFLKTTETQCLHSNLKTETGPF